MKENFPVSWKKMKESCKLDINQSVPENILSRPEVKRKQCGRDRLQIHLINRQDKIYQWKTRGKIFPMQFLNKNTMVSNKILGFFSS